jgi:hypothetical protein
MTGAFLVFKVQDLPLVPTRPVAWRQHLASFFVDVCADAGVLYEMGMTYCNLTA